MALRDCTARMADTLAVLNAALSADPMANPFLNAERAAALKALAATQSGSQAMNTRNFMADELLKAGRPREAIAELEALLRDAGVRTDTITPQLKPVYDLIAIAYLRLGEQENCFNNPAANVCILPLKGGAHHTNQEGARGAIARYSQLLRFFPEDRGSQYLLNIA